MASNGGKKGASDKNKQIIGGVIGFFIILIGLAVVFGTPSAETVFKDMNEEMLKTKSVIIEQKLAMKGSAEINSRLYMDFNSNKELLSKGNFSLDITSDGLPMTFGGDLIKVGESNYVRFSKISSSDSSIAPSLSATESKLKNNWIKIRDVDQFATIAKTPLSFTENVLPTPFANLNDLQRKDVLTLLQDKSMYTIAESSKVDTAGISAYKYSITFNSDQYKKVAKAISGYVDYFKSDDSSDSEISSFTVWVNISTKQIIKIEYTGTTQAGDITGTIAFSEYNQTQTVEKPSDYSIESELLN